MKIQQFLHGTEYMYNVACLFGRHDGMLNGNIKFCSKCNNYFS